MVWVHVAANLLMLVLDAAWWCLAMRLVKGIPWRVLISLFIAALMTADAFELLGWMGTGVPDLALYLPKDVLAVTVIWHYLGLPAFMGLGFIYLCLWMNQRRRSNRAKKLQPPAAPAPDPSSSINRREFIGACATLAPPLLTFSLTGIAAGQLNHFRVRRFTLAIPSLPRPLDGLTIAHITDVHVGTWTHGKILQDMVNTTNALRADLVLMTGDLINFELTELTESIGLLKRMHGRYGQWMVEGNHDLLDNGVEFERRVKAAGLNLLLDESQVGTVRGCPVQFFGIRWMDGIGARRDRETALQVSALMKHRQPEAFPIFLAHHPHAFDAAVEAGLPLTLTGHTHGGQLMLDSRLGVGPALFRYWSGLYQKQQSQLIVANGVGNMFPIRINAPAEIVHITLRCA